MDVRICTRTGGLMLLAACFNVSLGALALADPVYTIADLGSASPNDSTVGSLSFGTDSTGQGTVTGSNGLTYTFNPAQNFLPAQWIGTSQGVPAMNPPPVWNQDTYGNPNFAF